MGGVTGWLRGSGARVVDAAGQSNIDTLSHSRGSWLHGMRRTVALGLSSLVLLGSGLVQAQETVCARVKIEVKQELTLERQAFDAQIKINNTTTGIIENVSMVVKIMERNGTPVAITDDPNNLMAWQAEMTYTAM